MITRLGTLTRAVGGAWIRGENGLAGLLLLAVAALPLCEGAGRLLGAGTVIPGSLPLVQHATFLIALVGGAIAAREGKLLALSTASFLPSRLRPVSGAVSGLAGVAVCTCLAFGSWEFATVERDAGDVVALALPVWVVVAAMVPAFALIGLRLAWKSSQSWGGRAVAAAGVAIPVALATWEALGDLPIAHWGALALLLGAILGLPIFALIGGLAALLFWYEYTPLSAVPLAAYQLSGQPLLPAIPLFTLAGYILAEGGSSRRMVRVFSAWLGWLPGGLAPTTAVAFAFFTSFTGASGVTILSLGGLMLPILVKSGYGKRLALGLMTASGSIGLLFPPSLAVILYGVYSRTPLDELFLGGLLPGMVLVALVGLLGARGGRAAGEARRPFVMSDARAAAWSAKWELLLPVVVLGGILGGLVTLLEAAAVTVLYAFLLECVVHRDVSLRVGLPKMAVECSALVGGVLLILGVALGFTNYLIDAQVPDIALEWVQSHIESKYVFLLALNGLLLIVGCMMDIFSAILVLVPLIAPMGAAYGVDPVHLGIIFLANLELGYLTPPVGLNLFLSSYRFGVPLVEVYRAVLPFLLILCIGVLLITYVPALSLALVR